MNVFYNDLDLKYAEMAITKEKFYKRNPGKVKCSIPILMPCLDTTAQLITSNINIANKDSAVLKISKCTTYDYIELEIPAYIVSDLPVDDNGYVSAGVNLIIVFIGGDINNPKVIGRY